MEILLVAIGSMLLVMLIVQFLPISLTKNGKIVVVLAAFLLALLGLIAIPSFSLWKVIIMLLGLISFTAYLINTRLGHLLFVSNDSFGKKLLDQKEPYIDYNKINKAENVEKLSFSRKGVASSIEPIEDREVFDFELFYSQHETKRVVERNDELHEAIEDDISFLLNRNIQIEEEKNNEESFFDMEYISDIESLLLETSSDVQKIDGSDGLSQELQDIDELPVLTFDHSPLVDKERIETTNPLNELEEIPLLTFQDDDFEKPSIPKERIPVKV